jgi:hypothetical protein
MALDLKVVWTIRYHPCYLLLHSGWILARCKLYDVILSWLFFPFFLIFLHCSFLPCCTAVMQHLDCTRRYFTVLPKLSKDGRCAHKSRWSQKSTVSKRCFSYRFLYFALLSDPGDVHPLETKPKSA